MGRQNSAVYISASAKSVRESVASRRHDLYRRREQLPQDYRITDSAGIFRRGSLTNKPQGRCECKRPTIWHIGQFSRFVDRMSDALGLKLAHSSLKSAGFCRIKPLTAAGRQNQLRIEATS